MSIIFSLFKHADTIDSQLRLLKKFLELEKIDRLVELHAQYTDIMNSLSISAVDNEDEDQLYLDRLEAGLFTLQMVDLVMLNCIALERPETVINHILIIEYKRPCINDAQ
jgi:beta-catenin-like protein 1